ncbi:unnamed protein product [Cyclocybe aegerita]|uniref:Uncharacterized protein n=1 Tax=Cyclocybe aegerita TaxID=1973307 RepID=A0A8S0VRM0_CYCAE|nr:unnamed protein product [Cyclocybe aegerita]
MEAVASASECQNEPTECKRKMLNPIEEQEFGEMDFRFENDDAIVEKVRYEEAVKAGKIVEIESDEEEEEAEDKMSNLDRRDASLELTRQLRGFKASASGSTCTRQSPRKLFKRRRAAGFNRSYVTWSHLVTKITPCFFQPAMFNSFKRRLPEISIFHHPSSPPSTKALNLLRSSLSGPYPPGSAKGQPLHFNLEVVESAPNSDQLGTIMSYFPSKVTNPSMVFLSAHPTAPSGAEKPSTLKGIAELAAKNPNAIKWPIVVDWNDGQASVGDVEGVKQILETLRKRRDGELKEEEVYQPKGWFS